MRFAVLGPVRAYVDGAEVSLGARQQRVTLALLLAADGAVVATDVLVDGVWEGRPPATARKALQGYVHHLRTHLGGAIETHAAGYSLPAAVLDADRFVTLHDQATALLDVDPARAAELLREGLSLWHGPAYADLRDHAVVDTAARGLDDRRIVAVGDRVDADLAVGRHRQLVAELEALAAEHPFHERFRRQLMLAQYRCGRQVDALRGYARHRDMMAAEFGLEPAPDLRDLERRILRQDPTLDVAEAHDDAVRAVRGYELRERVDATGDVVRHRAYQRSVGRDVLLTVYGPAIADDPAFVAGYESTAAAVAALQHPHVTPIIDTWREPGRAYQASHWLGGGTLADRLGDGDAGLRGLPTLNGLRLLREVAEALHAAHRAGVHHGSVGARAVWLDGDGHAYLGGFTLVPEDGPSARGADVRAFARLAGVVLQDPTARIRAVLDEAVEGEPLGVLQLVRLLEQEAGTSPAAVGLSPGASTASTRAPRRNPYKGLRAFGERDAGDFHGRESLVDALVAAVDRHRLVAVVGASGSGKSSAVAAGLLPRLRARHAPDALFVTTMFPGTHPFEELASALSRIAVEGVSLDQIDDDERGLLRAVKRLRAADDAEVLLVVDQFEELFTMVDDEARDRFVAALVTAVEEPHAPLRVVLTLRADFFDRPLAHPRLGPLVRAGLVPVTPPTPAELARAITAPAAAEGVEYADGLVRVIADDVGREPGALPLLQHALTELFDARATDVISFEDYRATGGVLGALGRRADALYEQLPPSARAALRQVLLRLVAVDGTARDLRRRVFLSELQGLAVDQAGLEAALDTFAAHRLLVFDRDEATRARTVEIAHEALLREWPRLADWVDEHRDDLRMRRRLVAIVEEWQAAGEDPAYLARGRRLAELEGWAAETSLALGHVEHSFLQQSLEAEAVADANRARRRRRTTTSFAAATVVLALVAGLAVVQRAAADRLAFESETARLVATAVSLAEDRPRVALNLAVLAHEREQSPATTGGLQTVLTRMAPVVGVLGGGTPYIDVEWLADGHVLAVREDGIDLHDPDTGSLVDTVELAVGTGTEALNDWHLSWRASAARRTPRVAVQTEQGPIRLYDVIDGRLVLATTVDAGTPSSTVAVADDGAWVAAGTLRGELVLWDADGTERHRERVTRANDLRTVVEDQLDGTGPQYLSAIEGLGVPVVVDAVGDEVWVTVGTTVERYTPSGDRLARVQTAATGTQGVWPTIASRFEPTADGIVVAGPNGVGVVDAAAFVDGGRVDLETFEGTGRTGSALPRPAAYATGLVWHARSDGALEATDPRTGERVESHELSLRGPLSASVAPDGSMLAVATSDGVVLVSPYGAGPLGHAVAREERQDFLTVSHDGAYVVLSPEGRAGPIDVVAVRDHGAGVARVAEVDLGIRSDGANNYAYAPAEERDVLHAVVIGRSDRRWDLAGDEPRLVMDAAWLGGLAHVTSPDGSVLLTAWDDAIRVHDATTGDLRRVLAAPGGAPSGARVSSLRFSPDGTRLLAALETGHAELLATDTWVPVGRGLLAGEDVIAGGWNDDGSLLATIASDGRISIRDADTGTVRRTIVGMGEPDGFLHDPPLFVEDDTMLLTNNDGAARLWDLATGEQVGEAMPTAPQTRSGTNRGDAAQLVTATERGALLWNLDVDEWAAVACRAAGAALAVDEWERWGPRDSTDHGSPCGQQPGAPAATGSRR